MATEDELNATINLMVEMDPSAGAAAAALMQSMNQKIAGDAQKFNRLLGSIQTKLTQETIRRSAVRERLLLKQQDRLNQALLVKVKEGEKRQTAAEAAEAAKRLTTQKGRWAVRLANDAAAHKTAETQQKAAAKAAEQADKRHTAQVIEGDKRRTASHRAALRAQEIEDAKNARLLIASREKMYKEMLQAQRYLDNQRLIDQRSARSKELLTQRTADRLVINEEHASQVRRNIRTRFFWNGLRDMQRAGLQAMLSGWRSHLVKREQTHRTADAKMLSTLRSDLARQETAERLSLERRNATYTAGAKRRLDTIERANRTETEVITRNAVKRAEVEKRVQQVAGGGVLGVATAGRLSGGFKTALLGAGGFLSARALFGPVIDYEQTRIAFEGILGTEARAKAFLKTLRDFAAVTPFDQAGLIASSKQLLAVGFSVEEVIPALTKIGNVAATLGVGSENISSVVRALGQMKGKGKASAEELNQISEAIPGFSAVQAIAESLGITTAEAFKQMEKGAIPANVAIDAILAGMERFKGSAGAMERQSQTLGGRIETLKDTFKNLLIDATLPLVEPLANLVGLFTDFLTKLFTGRSIWRVVRSGLLGIGVGLAAILAAKGAVQVLQLTGLALKAIAANPLFLIVGGLGALAGVLYSLANKSGAITNFFKGLYEGTKNWIEVGYKLGEPIKGLSAIVNIQSSIGAAARVIVDAVKGIIEVVKSLLSGGDLKTGGEFITGILGNTVDAISKLTAPILTAIDNLLAQVKEKVGGGILGSILGGGGAAGLSGRALLPAIGGSLAYKLAKDAAVQGGIKMAGVIAAGAAAGLAIGFVARKAQSGEAGEALWSDLLSGSSDERKKTAETLWGNLKGIASDAWEKLKEWAAAGKSILSLLLAPVGNAASSVLSGIGDFFSKSILPALIELPQKIGKFLSSNLFREPVLKGLLTLAAAVGAAAVVIAGGFIKGFLEGIWQRRGDIAETIKDTLGFVVKTVAGSGNPFLILGAGLVAMFTGAKIIGAIGSFLDSFKKLRNNLSAGWKAIGGDIAGAKQQVQDFRTEQAKSKSVPGVGGIGTGIPQMAADLRANAAKVKSGWQGLTADMSQRWQSFQGDFNTRSEKIQAVGTTLAGGIASAFALASDNVQIRTTGIIGSITNIAYAAMGPGGQILGPLAALTAAVGVGFALFSKESKKHKETVRVMTQDTRDLTDSLKTAFTGDDINIPFTGPLDKASKLQVALRSIGDNAKDSQSKVARFLDGFNATIAGSAQAMIGGEEAWDSYVERLSGDEVDRIFRNNKESILDWKDEIKAAGKQVGDAFQAAGDSTLPISSQVQGLVNQFADGKITVSELEDKFTELGGVGSEALARLKQAVGQVITDSDLANYGALFGPALGAALRELRDEREAEILYNQLVEDRRLAGLNFLERIKEGWGKVKDAISAAKDTFDLWLDRVSGKQVTFAQSQLSIAGDAQQFDFTPEGESEIAQNVTTIASAQSAFGDAYAQMVAEAKGDIGAFDRLLDQYRTNLKGVVADTLKKQKETEKGAKLNQQELNEVNAQAEAFTTLITTPIPSREATVQMVMDSREADLDLKGFTEGWFGKTYKIKVGVEWEEAPNPPTPPWWDFFLNPPEPKAPPWWEFFTKPPVPNRNPDRWAGFAFGGIVRRKQLAWLGEDGPEVVIPLNKPARATQIIKDAFPTIFNDGGRNAPTPSDLTTDPDSFADAEEVNGPDRDPREHVNDIRHVLVRNAKKGRVASAQDIMEYMGLAVPVDTSNPFPIHDVMKKRMEEYIANEKTMTDEEKEARKRRSVRTAEREKLEDEDLEQQQQYYHDVWALLNAKFMELQTATAKLAVGNAVDATKGLLGFANGGIVRKKQLAWVGEDGPEAIVPLDNPRQASRIMQQAGLTNLSLDGTLNPDLGAKLDRVADAIERGASSPMVGTMTVVGSDPVQTARATVRAIGSYRFRHGTKR